MTIFSTDMRKNPQTMLKLTMDREIEISVPNRDYVCILCNYFSNLH